MVEQKHGQTVQPVDEMKKKKKKCEMKTKNEQKISAYFHKLRCCMLSRLYGQK